MKTFIVVVAFIGLSLIFSATVLWGTTKIVPKYQAAAAKRKENFYTQCLSERKRYECDVLWHQLNQR